MCCFESKIPKMEKIAITPEIHKKLISLLNVLISNPKSIEFRQPVDYISFGLLDYPTIVLKPMDLGTVSSKLTSEIYTTLVGFNDDICLIWNNCKLYNRQGSEIYKQAEYMERLYIKTLNKLKTELGISKKKKKKEADEEDEEDEEDAIGFEEKIKLAEEVRKLDNECLTKFVKFIKENCAKALEDLDAEKLQIKIDEIDKDSFENVKELISEFGKENSKEE